MDKRVIVIGAGLGGLSAAIRLAHAGFQVEIFEQSDKPGGKASEHVFNGFRFDTGPSLLTMPFVIHNLFADVDEKIEEYLEILPLTTLCRYFWNDGTVVNAYAEIEKFAEEFESKTGNSREALVKFLNYSETIYKLTSELFLFNDFASLTTFANFKALKTLLQIRKIDPFRTMHEANQSFFKDEKTIQLFDRYATYNGSNPYKAPATLNIIPHVEYTLGGYIAKDGIYSIVKALYKLAGKNGVKFNFNCSVTQIKKDSGRVIGVEFTDGRENKFLKGDTIISNADVNYTYSKLLDGSDFKDARKYREAEISTSALVFYWGVEGISPELEVHNILFSSNYENEFKHLFEMNEYPEDPTVYIYVSSKFNSKDAPDGCENWFVMVNAPRVSNRDLDSTIKALREKILSKIHDLLKIDLKNKIIAERVMTPEDIEIKTSSYRGGLYGIASNNRSAAFMRQKNKSRELQGLYFCGGSAHPGGGIPLVILSGKHAADQVIKYAGDR